MPNDNLLGIRDSQTGNLIKRVPVIASVADGVTIIDCERFPLENRWSTYDRYFRIQVEHLLSEGYKYPTYVSQHDHWQLTSYWIIGNTWAIFISFAPGEAGSHFYALPQGSLYCWEDTAFLARVTLWKEGQHWGTKEYVTPEQTLEWLREYIED